MNAIGADPNDWDKHFILMADLDMTNFDGQNGNPTYNIIGTSFQSTFTGLFNGNGFIISNLSWAQTTSFQQGIGLFGIVGSGGELQNITLTNVSVSAKLDASSFIGSLAGIL